MAEQLRIEVNPNHEAEARMQIYWQLAWAIERGRIASGLLPAVDSLARQSALEIEDVEYAYCMLALEGLVRLLPEGGAEVMEISKPPHLPALRSRAA